VILLAPSVASAGPPPHSAPLLRNARLETPAHRTPAEQSVGSPTEGHLIGGAHLTESTYLRIVPVYQAGDARWGLEPLVSMIDRAARTVRKQFPDAVLSVGHLSRAGGGEIDRHASHESGRDADIGFYVKNHLSKPVYADHFVPFKGDGTAKSWPGAEFDDARNWALVATIATDAHAHVTHIFVASPIRARLLHYAEKIGAPLATRVRASELMAQPKGALPHDDHFHVRIGCPTGMEKCIEQPLARHNRARAGGGALAHAATGHAAVKAHSATSPGSGSTAHAHPAPPSSHEEAPHDGAARSDERREENVVPSLAPMVPGLDAAVIPAPIFPGNRPRSLGEDDLETLPPGAQPIDDPDGVLEHP
jgi:penicillin-insensitive murein endopeptidase